VPLELPPDDPCSFCGYLAGTPPYTILERDEITATLVTFEQRGQGHVLVVPARHVSTIIDLTPNEQWAVMDAVARAAGAIVGASRASPIRSPLGSGHTYNHATRECSAYVRRERSSPKRATVLQRLPQGP
jgi:hypothetical protein